MYAAHEKLWTYLLTALGDQGCQNAFACSSVTYIWILDMPSKSTTRGLQRKLYQQIRGYEDGT